MKKHNIWDLLIWIFSAELVGAFSALITGSFSDFFLRNEVPSLQPPSLVFPIVWVILYALMGASAYLVSSSDAPSEKKRSALTLYWAQLAVNFSWSILFIRFELLWAGVVVVVLLLVLIIIMTVLFNRINSLAAYLNILYIVWVAFASYLTVATTVLNQ